MKEFLVYYVVSLGVVLAIIQAVKWLSDSGVV